MQYNFANIINAQNELQSKLSQSMKESTNLKSDLKKKTKQNKVCLLYLI